MKRLGIPPGPWSTELTPTKGELRIVDAEGVSIGVFDELTAKYIVQLENQARAIGTATKNILNALDRDRAFSNDPKLVQRFKERSPKAHRGRV